MREIYSKDQIISELKAIERFEKYLQYRKKKLIELIHSANSDKTYK